MRLPVLALINSAASGFRFCGMIDEPVENASGKIKNPKGAEAKTTISSASRDKCVMQIVPADSVSNTKSLSDTLSMELSVGLSKPSAFAV